MAIFSPVIMRLFGREFVAGATTLSILSVAMLVNTGCGSCGVVLSMTGRTVANLTIAFLAAAVDVGGNPTSPTGACAALPSPGGRHGHRGRGILIVLFKQFDFTPSGEQRCASGSSRTFASGSSVPSSVSDLDDLHRGVPHRRRRDGRILCPPLALAAGAGTLEREGLDPPVVSTSGEDSGAGEAPQYVPDDRFLLRILVCAFACAPSKDQSRERVRPSSSPAEAGHHVTVVTARHNRSAMEQGLRFALTSDRASTSST